MGDKVFTIDKKDVRIKEIEVSCVNAFQYKDRTSVTYNATDETPLVSFNEETCFASKHELLTYLERPEKTDDK